MVSVQPSELDAIFRCLADPTRRAMLRRLTDGDCKLTELAAPFAMSFPAASKHVRMLEAAGLVTRRVQGRDHLIHIETDRLRRAHAWFDFYDRFWTARLDALDAALKDRKAGT
jgi:DNA-binding transcriptional ArsR family regulator